MPVDDNAHIVPHVVIPWKDLDTKSAPRIQNILVKSTTARGLWIEKSSLLIGEYRSHLMSRYVQWALSINGLHVASERYSDPDWCKQHQFTVSALRPNDRGTQSPTTIAQWDGPTAARNHLDVVPKLAAWGIVELYSILEEFLFALYREHWNHKPDDLISGREYKELRKLKADALQDPAHQREWTTKWNARLDQWQRKRLYDGLDQVLLAYMAHTHLQKPNVYKLSTPTTWAESLKLIATLRHSLVHGAKTVSSDLAAMSSHRHNAGLHFKEGDILNLDLFHLQAVEVYANQLLTALNLSLAEHKDAFK